MNVNNLFHLTQRIQNIIISISIQYCVKLGLQNLSVHFTYTVHPDLHTAVCGSRIRRYNSPRFS